MNTHQKSWAHSRMSRMGSEACELKKEDLKCRKEKKPRVENMDRNQMKQCWVILKRLMIGRDGWAFKQPLDVKDLEFLDDSEAISKPMSLKDIESKLNKSLYSRPEEFADDMRLVFIYAMRYPSKTEVHKIAMRVSEDFESSWKSLKKKWIPEERKVKKMGSMSKT